MNLTDFVASVSSFASMSHTDRLLCVAWYLCRHDHKNSFSAGDILASFKDANLAQPSSIDPFLRSLAMRKPPLLVRRDGKYAFEHHALDSLDKKYGQRTTAIHVDKLLSELPARILISDERVYLDEALACFRIAAFRAAIVMTWNVVYAHLCNYILTQHLAAFNAQLPRSFPRAEISAIVKRDDFQELKESQVIHVCKSANIISGSLHKVLKEKLDRRNISAHPSGIAVSQLTAEEFIRNLIENVVLKL